MHEKEKLNMSSRAIADFLATDFANEISVTIRVIEAIPETGLNYQPDPKSKTALGLARHLAIEDAWLLNAVADGAFGPGQDESDACGIMNAAQAAAHYNANVLPALDRVKALSDEDAARTIDFFGNQLPATVVLAIALKHSIHHRGQLSSYLRAGGGKVPGIYGPSADSQ
jgi:uncharacterized damage-inducible protein DinB